METDTSIYFYHNKNKFSFMSNFYICQFTDKYNIQYCCSEQYFMYQKCKLFDPQNQQLLSAILSCILPQQIKKYGRQVKNFDNIIWNKKKYKIMVKGLKLKFSQNDEIKQQLLETQNKILYEASPYDKIWGYVTSIKKLSENI
jgi:ribA/ribD-fused uncharacterized protein